jgi:NH3-dependent NAD+ synthetase
MELIHHQRPEELILPARTVTEKLPREPRCLAPEATIDSLIRWLEGMHSTRAPHSPGLALQVSGGTDSALALWICEKALPGRVEALFFGRKLRGEEWFESIAPGRVRTLQLPDVDISQLRPALGDSWHLGTVDVDPDPLRWAIAQTVAKYSHRWLVGTLNRSELVLGNYSNASRAAVVNPLENLWKSEILELCRFIGVPESIIASSNMIDCDCGRPAELVKHGLHTVDRYLMVLEGELHPDAANDIPAAHRAYIDRLRSTTSFRQEIPYPAPCPVVA